MYLHLSSVVVSEACKCAQNRWDTFGLQELKICKAKPYESGIRAGISTCFPIATTASHSSLFASELHWAGRAQCLSKSVLPWMLWFTRQHNIFHLKNNNNFKNSYSIPCLDGGRGHVSRKSCMKISVKVRGAINKKPLLPGLFWEGRARQKSWKAKAENSRAMGGLLKHAYP